MIPEAEMSRMCQIAFSARLVLDTVRQKFSDPEFNGTQVPVINWMGGFIAGEMLKQRGFVVEYDGDPDRFPGYVVYVSRPLFWKPKA